MYTYIYIYIYIYIAISNHSYIYIYIYIYIFSTAFPNQHFQSASAQRFQNALVCFPSSASPLQAAIYRPEQPHRQRSASKLVCY